MAEIENATCFMNLPKLPPIKFGKEKYPLFTRISIETSKVCNRTCWFCPAEQRGKKQNLMDEELYKKIVRELKELKFDGVVQWFFINEPLMDKTWPTRIAYLRSLVPKCTIHVTSNWDLFAKRPDSEQIDIIESLFHCGVNSFNINDYDNKGYGHIVPKAQAEINARMIRATNRPVPKSRLVDVRDHCWKRLGPNRRVLSCGPLPKTLHTRTGYTKLEAIETGWKGGSSKGAKHCPRPFRHIVVQYDGKVPLCCTIDPTSIEAEWMGDVNNQSLVDVWNSKRMFEYRLQLQDGKRVDQCTKCDAKFSFPSIVRRVTMGKQKVSA